MSVLVRLNVLGDDRRGGDAEEVLRVVMAVDAPLED
jgi:hypothetical protein